MQERQNAPIIGSSKVAAEIAAKANESVQPKTRVVRLKSQSCCGCGCSDVTVIREVNYDSPLKDGDYIHSSEWLSTDKIK